uniref:Histone H2A n=1 Tax=Globodera rostochiensis TaxID=31243 RepID=A0A914I2K9_GLORO
MRKSLADKRNKFSSVLFSIQQQNLYSPSGVFIVCCVKENSPIVWEPAPVYLAAVLEYLVAEVVELAGKTAQDNNKKRVNPRHLQLAIRNDEELSTLFSGVIISQGGVLPHIQAEVLPKRVFNKRLNLLFCFVVVLVASLLYFANKFGSGKFEIGILLKMNGPSGNDTRPSANDTRSVLTAINPLKRRVSFRDMPNTHEYEYTSSASTVAQTPTKLLMVDELAKYGAINVQMNHTHVIQHTPFHGRLLSFTASNAELVMLNELTKRHGDSYPMPSPTELDKLPPPSVIKPRPRPSPPPYF